MRVIIDRMPNRAGDKVPAMKLMKGDIVVPDSAAITVTENCGHPSVRRDRPYAEDVVLDRGRLVQLTGPRAEFCAL
jgi:hypothetical protein